MADCGAGGTTLDRTVQAFLGSDTAAGNSGLKVAAAAKAVLGHASQQHPVGVSVPAMPLAAPRELTLPSALHQRQRQQQQQQRRLVTTTATTLSAVQPNLMIKPPPNQQQQSVYQTQHAGMYPHPSMMQQQQQQQMMMMQSMMMQQQQQLAQMVQQQQQQQMNLAKAQQQQQQQQKVLESPAARDDMSELLNEEELRAELQKHLTGLEGLQELENHYNEGLVQGASIEELAEAWAQAEADYTYVADDFVNDAVNLAAGIDITGSSSGGVRSTYEFVNKVSFPRTQTPLVDWMQEGMRHFQAGNLREAIRAFEMELQLQNSNNAKAWRMLGKCHAENDQDREAIICLEHAVDRDPYSQEALLDLGVSYVNELDHEKALQALLSWITNNPHYAGMQLTDDFYGSSVEAQKGPTTSSSSSSSSFEEVQRLLLHALEYDPAHAADVWQALGVVYNVSRDYNAAIDSFEKALVLEPDNYQLWNKLGATCANSNRSEHALMAYHKALAMKPKYARAWLNMAIAHSNLNNYEEAARCYLQTLSLNPAAVHCWSYLRIALSCAEQFDLIPLAAAQDLPAFADHYDFVLYNTSGDHLN